MKSNGMNIEDYREYCLSLGEDVEEKLPFTAFHHASGVLGYPPRDYQSRGFLPSTFMATCFPSLIVIIIA